MGIPDHRCDLVRYKAVHVLQKAGKHRVMPLLHQSAYRPALLENLPFACATRRSSSASGGAGSWGSGVSATCSGRPTEEHLGRFSELGGASSSGWSVVFRMVSGEGPSHDTPTLQARKLGMGLKLLRQLLA